MRLNLLLSKACHVMHGMRSRPCSSPRIRAVLTCADLAHTGVTTVLLGVFHESFALTILFTVLCGVFLEVQSKFLAVSTALQRTCSRTP